MLEITLSLSAEKGAPFLPVYYHSGFVSLIKQAIQQENQTLFHALFEVRKPIVKPYTFAVSFGDNVKVEEDKIYFNKEVHFKFSSFSLQYLVAVYNFFILKFKTREAIRIFNENFYVSNVLMFPERKITRNSAIFRTLSPVLIRSHKNEKHYLVPKCDNFDGDDGFEEALRFNLDELLKNLLGKGLNDFGATVEFRPVKLSRVIVKYLKDDVLIKMPAFKGVFSMSAHPEILNLIVRAGLGSRRSQGFGMLELIREI